MEKDKHGKTTRRNPLDSLVGRSSKGYIGFLEKPKTSLATSNVSRVLRKGEDSLGFDQMHNRSAQMSSTQAFKPFPGTPIKKGFQDLISKSVASINIPKADKNSTSPGYKKGLKITDSVFSQSVYKIGNSPKVSTTSAAYSKPSSTNKGSSLFLAGSSKAMKKAKRESTSKANKRSGFSKTELHVYETFQEFLGISSKQYKAPKDDKGRSQSQTEDGMSTTRPISVEDNKPIKFKPQSDKKRLSATGLGPGLPLAKKKDFRSTDFGQQKCNIVIDIPKKYQHNCNLKDSWVDFKSYAMSSTSSKNDLLRLSSQEKDPNKKEVSLSIRGRVNVVKESPLIPFNSKTKTSVFFPANSGKDNKLHSKDSKGQSTPR
jgi:hypothetical protein